VILIRALFVLSGLCLMAVSFFFLRLIARAKAAGAWINPNLRVYLVARVAGYAVTGALFIAGAVWRQSTAFYAAAAVLFANYAAGWRAQRRNGRPLTVREAKPPK
jgi:hypothetical protein